MKIHRYISSLKIKINFIEDLENIDREYSEYILNKNKIRNICKEFDFSMIELDSSNFNYFKCKTKDHDFNTIKQRLNFVIKRLNDENNVEILKFKIKAILVDSNVDKIKIKNEKI